MADDRSQTDKNNRKSQSGSKLERDMGHEKKNSGYGAERIRTVKKNAGQESEFYDTDMSRKAVGRLFEDDTKNMESASPTTVKKSLNEVNQEQADKEYFDYINTTSQRSKKELALKEARRENMKKIREESVKELHEAEEEYYDDSPVGAVIDFFVNSEARYIVAGIIIFILILFTFLIVKINSTGSQLKKANESIAGYEEMDKEHQDLLIEAGNLRTQVSELTAELDEANDKITSLEAAATGTAGSNTTPPAPNASGNTQTQTGSRSHTVATGDTAWGLAEKYYNDGSQYGKILSANGLQEGATLGVGTVLTIP